MQRGTTVADRELPVKLRDDEMLDRAHTLAQKVAYREGLVDSKKSDAKKWQDQIDEADEEIARLARIINDGFENRAQMDLFADQLPKDQAAQRLAEIAVIAAKHPFIASESSIDSCAKDGCGAAAGADVHVAPLPSQPHTFSPDGSGEGKCWACGSGADDPVHAEPKVVEPTVRHAFMADAGAEGVCSLCGGPATSLVHGTAERDPNAPHAAELGEQPEGEPKACLFCSRAVEDPIHDTAGIETANTPANETGENAEEDEDNGDVSESEGLAQGKPHDFVREPNGPPDQCEVCGKGPEDPRHRLEELAADLAAVVPPAADLPATTSHKFKAVGGKGLAGQVCATCGGGKTDPIHGEPAAEFDPALDEVETPAKAGGAGA